MDQDKQYGTIYIFFMAGTLFNCFRTMIFIGFENVAVLFRFSWIHSIVLVMPVLCSQWSVLKDSIPIPHKREQVKRMSLRHGAGCRKGRAATASQPSLPTNRYSGHAGNRFRCPDTGSPYSSIPDPGDLVQRLQL